MNAAETIDALSALANEHRLSIYRQLVERGPEGMAAGEIAEALGMPPSSLSFHLAHMRRAGVITQRRESRSLIYAAEFDRMNALVDYLTANCCGGRSCAPAKQERKKRA